MDNDRRQALEHRRRFMRQRIDARAFRDTLNPAWTALERAGETFRVYRLGDEPDWQPEWLPEGYSYIPWHALEDVERSAEQLADEALADLTRQLLAERLGPDDALLVVADVGDWTLGLRRAVFDRHAEPILQSCFSRCWIAAPPAPWLVALEGHFLVWKDA